MEHTEKIKKPHCTAVKLEKRRRTNTDLIIPRDKPSGEGAPCNTHLSNFVSHPSALSEGQHLPTFVAPGSALSDEPQCSYLPNTVKRSHDANQHNGLHCGLDTVQWHYRVEDDVDLEMLHERFEPLAEAGNEAELEGFGKVLVRRAGKNYKYTVNTGSGLRLAIPRELIYPVMVYADPTYVLSMPQNELEYTTAGIVALVLGMNPDTPLELSLSRVDIALDVELPAAVYHELAWAIVQRDGAVVCRARKHHLYTDDGNPSGIQVGKGDVVLRVYDKMKEATQSGDWGFWQTHYGGVAVQAGNTVVRFEYQLRRDFLRSMVDNERPDGIDTLTDFLTCAGSVMDYLTQAWFRLADAPQGENHTRTTTAWWQGISNLFCGAWTGFCAQIWRDTRRQVARNVEKVMAMAAGCLASAAALLGYRDGRAAPYSPGEVLFHLRSWMDATRDDWIAKSKARYEEVYYGYA